METFVSFKKENLAFIIENKAAAIWLFAFIYLEYIDSQKENIWKDY